MIHGSMTHDFTGRKRKPRKAKGPVLKKYTHTPFRHATVSPPTSDEMRMSTMHR